MKFLIGNNYLQEVLPLINRATSSIDILAYQWGYYAHTPGTNIQSFSYAIKSAIIRGVKVRVLLHSGCPSDHLRRINADMASHLKSWGASVKFYKSGRTLHSKVVMIDREYVIIGSHNFSKMSMSSNIEVSVLLFSAAEIRPICEFFDLLFSNS